MFFQRDLHESRDVLGRQIEGRYVASGQEAYRRNVLRLSGVQRRMVGV
jgi:hypothetical protein